MSVAAGSWKLLSQASSSFAPGTTSQSQPAPCALKGQFNSAQWQRLGLTGSHSPRERPEWAA